MANPSVSQLSSGGGQSSFSGSSLLSTIGSVVGAISNPIGSIISWLANKDAAKERNQFAIEQWQRENAYNRPLEQIKRLKEAGLNPALMYENGASGLVSAQSPDISMPSSAHFQGIDPLTAAQIAKLNAETESVSDSNDRANVIFGEQLEKIKEENKNLKQKRTNMIAEVNQMNASTERMYVDISLDISRFHLDVSQFQKSCELWNSQIAKNNSEAQLTSEQYTQLVALYELKKQGIELSNREIQSRIEVNHAEAVRLSHCLDLMDSQIADIDSNKNLRDKELEWYETNQKCQNHYLNMQSEYWKDYKMQPWKYRSKTQSESHEFHGGSSGVGGSSHKSTTW